MLLTFIILYIIFLTIGIYKNKGGRYVKQTAFSSLILFILISTSLSMISANSGGVSQIGFLNVEDIPNLFIFSIIGILISLLIYIYSDFKR
ncbi:hypothetical protein D5F52_08230 [Brevibacillus laterosporus]|nr:hypothetical protein BrL25_21840 [Brevibacillus laterosporus DSM 25]AYB38255.1 hypothetical protein D5F52_08230 [Brevibacillus laterosporus]MBG9797261.1 hypothetical protein [Brevibacillus laterosporus]MBG9801652.1 hypothetical protein [Brevibacillus laterosporus]MBM7110995.1 hypothetical protein [Brevibacillus laterosporus]